MRQRFSRPITIHNRYVAETAPQVFITVKSFAILALNLYINRKLYFRDTVLILSTKTLKHIYDKRPLSDYLVLIKRLRAMISNPDAVYLNKPGRTADLVFTHTYKDQLYLLAIEENKKENELHLVTAFRRRKKDMKGFTLIWSREGGEPPS
ncbi:MAG: hypothetical protein JNK26_03260 [Candidatus Doudnabacteria bacterium]|nr:hypothetical protein [Candidatus Doudnabacteria bacterium]